MKTIIQLTTTTPFTVVSVFPFIHPFNFQIGITLKVADKNYTLSTIEDVVDEKGITRYIRFK